MKTTNRRKRFQNDSEVFTQPRAAANAAGASQLQSLRPVRRVAELLSLDVMAITVPSNVRKFRAALIPTFVFVFGIGVVGLLSYVLATEGWHFDWHALAFAVGFQVVFSVVLSWMLSTLFPDAFSADGIYGHSFWGRQRFVIWRDVTDARTFRLLHLRWLRVYALDGKVTWLALFQSRGDEFRQEIRRLAPADNPVLRCL
jgi:hypothetical protein